MTTRLYSNYEALQFSAGQGYETVETVNYIANIEDDEFARFLCKRFPNYWRIEAWPTDLKISLADVMAAVRQEDDPVALEELAAMGLDRPSDVSLPLARTTASAPSTAASSPETSTSGSPDPDVEV